MGNNKCLNEESYQKSKNKIKRISIIILIIGMLIGITLITLGIMEKMKINSEYSIENKQNKIDEIESKIEIKEELDYDCAIISSDDKIVPTKNQINFWQNKAKIKQINSTHCPFEKFEKWSELLC